MPNTTKVMSLVTAHGELYLIQYYVIKFVSYLWQIRDFLNVLSGFLHTQKTGNHDITEILLYVVLNTLRHIRLRLILVIFY